MKMVWWSVANGVGKSISLGEIEIGWDSGLRGEFY